MALTFLSLVIPELTKSKPLPPDWFYVNNFKNSYEPREQLMKNITVQIWFRKK